MTPFQQFPSIPRLTREMIVTEKIDGTNGVVHVADDGTVLAGSRTKWIVPLADNHGFAAWVEAHADELRAGLGSGTHCGEWWGSGIQRKYGLTNVDKRFSLFNVSRWDEAGDKFAGRPACCGVVPVLYHGPFDTRVVDDCLSNLAENGSVAAPGFVNPEGVVIFHVSGNLLFKKTLDKNDGHKGVDR